MSVKTDDTLQSIQNIIAKGMPHKDEMYAVQGYCDMLKEEIAELEADIETLHTDLNTIIPQQDEEIKRANDRCDEEHHRACMYEESAKAWKATAERMANSFLRFAGRCHFCTHRHNDCDYDCDEVTDKTVLTHFGTPEEDA